MSTPYRSLDDVVTGLAVLEARFRAAHDRRSIFTTLYGWSLPRCATGWPGAPSRTTNGSTATRWRLPTSIAQAVDADDAGDTEHVPKAWRLCFDAARAQTGLVLTDMLLGVNAHVNHDLPYALNGISIEPDRESRYRDHAAVNAVLGAVTERATEQIASLYAPGIAGLDIVAGNLDEMTSAFSLDIARESAWDAALSLANARSGGERGRAMTMIGIRAAAVARLLLAPSLHPPLILACRHVERGGAWLTFVQGVARAANRPSHPRTLAPSHPRTLNV